MSDRKTAYPDGARSSNIDKSKPRQKISWDMKAGENRSGDDRSGAHRSGGYRKQENRSGSKQGGQKTAVAIFTQFEHGTPTQEAAFVFMKRAMAEMAIRRYDMGRYIYKLLINGEETKFEDPKEPAATATQFEHKKYFEDRKEARDNKHKLDRDMSAFIMDTKKMCSTTMTRELESVTDPKTLDDIIFDMDVQTLCTTLEGLAYNTIKSDRVYEPMVQADNWCKLTDQKIVPKQHIESHTKTYKAQLKAMRSLWGRLQPHKLVSSGMDTAKQEKAATKFETAMFLNSVSEDPRYRPIVEQLRADYYNKVNNYPETIDAAVSYLKEHEAINNRIKGYPKSNGLHFAQEDEDLTLEHGIVRRNEHDDDASTDSEESLTVWNTSNASLAPCIPTARKLSIRELDLVSSQE